MWSPFADFPREFGAPYRVCILKNSEELLQKVNLYNHKTSVFTSLYSFSQLNDKGNRGIYSTAVINKIYFDSDKLSLEPIQKLHSYCSERNLYHCFFFSGGGTHFYIGSEGNLKNPKGAVTNSQVKICDELNLKVGANGGSDIDSHAIGNLAQMVRVPNTYNLKRKLYCIPLSVSDLTLDIEEIKEKAKKPQYGIPVYGSKMLDLTPYDSEPIVKQELSVKDEIASLELEKINTEKFPPCVRSMLTESFKLDHNHKLRFALIVYLRDLGLSESAVIEFLRKILNAKLFRHVILEERQVYWCFKRRDLTFPSCISLLKDGVCKNEDGKCRGQELY